MVDLADIESAATQLDGVSIRTPLLQNFELDSRVGGKVLIKPECMQVAGAFKIRGAYNLMSRLSEEQRKNGVVGWSSGNHAQGVAAAGGLLNIPAAIVMPEDAPAAKINNTRRLGGEVISYDRYTGDREAIARAVATERGASLVPSFDHEHIIAGQGTVGLELADDAIHMGLPPDQVLIPCGGGGLSSGSAIALQGRLPKVKVFAVEPEDYDDTARSFKSGQRESVDVSARSICDALQTPMPGELTFEINQQRLAGVLTVTDAEVRAAIRFAFQNLKLVIEPGGAVALAALLAGKLDAAGKTTAIVLSGGNIDVDLFAEIQAEPN